MSTSFLFGRSSGPSLCSGSRHGFQCLWLLPWWGCSTARTHQELSSRHPERFRLEAGTIASIVFHDCHNITAVGTGPANMLSAVREPPACGGGLIAVQDGQVPAKLELPIAGLLSPLLADKLAPKIQHMKRTLNQLGLAGVNPLLCVATLALPVMPRVKTPTRVWWMWKRSSWCPSFSIDELPFYLVEP